uniref:Uncharacterized protein n=1 Tax=Arundo donax TaxID=35708 RepID=A0A0A9A956_ARUDO
MEMLWPSFPLYSSRAFMYLPRRYL